MEERGKMQVGKLQERLDYRDIYSLRHETVEDVEKMTEFLQKALSTHKKGECLRCGKSKAEGGGESTWFCWSCWN